MRLAFPRGRSPLLINSTNTKQFHQQQRQRQRQRQQQHRIPSLSSFFLKTSISLSSSSISPFKTLTFFFSSSPRTSSMEADDSTNHGFDRPEMFSLSVANTVDAYDRHVFLCYKTPDSWPAIVENSDADPLPKLLSSALKARKDDLPVKVCCSSISVFLWAVRFFIVLLFVVSLFLLTVESFWCIFLELLRFDSRLSCVVLQLLTIKIYRVCRFVYYRYRNFETRNLIIFTLEIIMTETSNL